MRENYVLLVKQVYSYLNNVIIPNFSISHRHVHVLRAKTEYNKIIMAYYNFLKVTSVVRIPDLVKHGLFLMLSIYLSLWLYGPFVGPSLLFQFLKLYTVGRTSWTGISPSQGRYLHTEQHKHRINAHRHTRLEWDSNPQSQHSSGHCDRPYVI
jgi:hypothetical protein